MSEFISQEQHNAEVAALNNEIRSLTEYINDLEYDRMNDSVLDPHDPFGNPTEYHDYQDDYSEVLPPVAFPEYKIRLEPSYEEQKKLKSFYSVGGWCVLLQFLFSSAAFMVLIPVVKRLLIALNPSADAASIITYIKGSSILMAANMLVYILANVGCALIGMRFTKTKISSLLKTSDFNVSKAVQYCFIAMFIWFASRVTAVGAEAVVEKFGYDVDLDSSGVAVTGLGTAVSLFYSCIIAPVTEEFFYRGMLLKMFSKANQRFAVFATAFFFGLGHGNLHQFILGFFMGIFLAHITLKHGSIIPSMFVHAFINTAINMMGFFELSRKQEYLMIFAMEVFAMIGAFVMLIFRIHDKVPKTTPAQASRGFAIARGSIGFILAAAIPTVYAVYNVYMNNL